MNYFIKEYISLFLENKKSFLDFYDEVKKEKEKPVDKEKEKTKEKEEKLPEDPYYYLRPGMPKKRIN